MQSREISNATSELLQSVSSSLTDHIKATQALLTQGQTLQNSIQASTEASAKSSVALKESATELRVSADSIKILGGQVHDASVNLSSNILKAVTSTDALAKQNLEISNQMTTLRDQLNSDFEKFNELTTKLTDLVNSAGSTFNELKGSHREFIEDLGLQVENLSNQIAKSLQEYANTANSQTAEHLKVWSNSVTDYATSMTAAVRALNNIVDSIETKLAD